MNSAMGNLIVFYTLAAVIVISSILAVTSRRMLRAATRPSRMTDGAWSRAL